MKTQRWIQVCLMAAIFMSGGAFADSRRYPDRPVRLIVPFPAGGSTDIVARLVAERLQAALGQPFVVDNKGGAGGNIGIGETIRSPADGYTLVLGSAQTLTINPQLQPATRFDPQKDLAPIVVIASMPNVLLVNNKVPAVNVAQLVALARQRGDKMSYGSTSVGSTPHLSAELLKSMTGTSIMHVPYRGSAPALQDLMGGQIDMIFDNLPSSLPHIRAGTVRALAVTALKRTPSAPELPTLNESGLKGFDSEGWFGLLAPAATPPAVLERLNVSVNEALKQPEFRERLLGAGVEPVGGSVDSFRRRIADETQRWAQVIKSANIKAE